jgi:hypothetical protein
MKISVPAMSADVCVRTLGNLSTLLDKGQAYAAARKFDPSVLVNARLAPDMFPLSQQVQIACDTAKKGCARLAAQEAPAWPDNEQSFEELKARVAKTVEYLKSIPSSAFEGAEDRDLKIPAGPELTLDFKGLDFLQTWMLPNLFFHVTAAYAILRHNGVDVGKRDFLGPR